ncbi:MAG: 30S ribosomal protein S16 [Nitrospirota bacterium]|nr:30S ribosomal protein S16 [Nitrospirota bacterium]
MAVTIRMTRMGRKKLPFYRVVVLDSRVRRDGRCLEVLGTFDPLAATGGLNLKVDRVDEWVSKGATVSDAVRDLVVRARATA